MGFDLAKALLRWSLRLMLIPLFALYGLWFIVTGGVGLVGSAQRAARLLAEAVPCPSCRTANELHGRWKCRACGAVYHGFVGCCELCGSGASFFTCRTCGVSIRLGRPP